MLAGTITLFGTILSGCGGGGTVGQPAGQSAGQAAGQSAAAEKNSKPYAGTTLRLVTANHAWTDLIKPKIPEFEQQTGIKVNLESYFEDQLTQKLTVEFTSGSSSVDVFMMRPLQEGKMFIQNGWVGEMTKKDDPDWDFKDFTNASTGSLIQGGKLYGVPIVTEREILYYRKDILEKNNIPVPKTLDELKQAAAKLNDPNNGFYGFVARGQRAAAVTQFSSFLYGMGGDFMKDGKATIDTPEAVSAFKTYGELLKSYGPPGVLNMSWPQAIGIFGQGKAAFYTDADSLYPNLLDPQKSSVGDKTGFALFPAGSKGQTPYNVTSWSLAIQAKSKNQAAAWEFVKWATSKQAMTALQGKGIPGPRQSVWNTDEGKKSFPPELVNVISKSNELGKAYDRPILINVGEARDVIGSVIVTAISGEDVEKAAKQANQQFQAIIDKEKK
ncbi:ABC transporter substrate-binding protein [Gordoniibacillus kamchatkensis]|uniref:ABC transporter substrate-binding protein n=2 Tax=Gordoniibacillus kamchatkensis TaxID=1590651 RepID=A0ABR5AJD5_9BACL|nr:ABC transporter substrate-binding protein [Paenibacillus sp. VKM B-2647]